MSVEIINPGATYAGAPLQVGETKSFDPTTESRLVSSGYAKYKGDVVSLLSLNGVIQTSDGKSLLTVAVDKLTGGIEISAGGMGFVIPERFGGFSAPSMLASLNTGAAADAVDGVVTVTSTSHGLPTNNSLYGGFKFFYPGSASLAAGWYSNYKYLTANTFSFSAPGADFASESISATLPYTAQTTVCTTVLPANSMLAGSQLTVSVDCAGTNAATGKSVRASIGSTVFASKTLNAAPAVSCDFRLTAITSGVQFSTATNVGAGTTTTSAYTKDLTADQLVDVSLILTAANEYAILYGARVAVSR